MEKKDAYNQTEFGFHNNNIENMINDFKSHLEKIDINEVMKHIHLNESIPIMSRNDSCRVPVNFKNKFGMCNPRMGLKCMVGGAGLSVMSSIIGYILILTLVIFVLACFLGYLFYLKHHNRCENKDCLFSFERDFMLQIKNDICSYVKKIICYLLKKSVSIINHISKFIHVSFDIYNKSVDELLLHIDSCGNDCIGNSGNCCIGNSGNCCIGNSGNCCKM